MKITFLAHSAFLVECQSYTMLFDWTGETPLPDFDRSKPLYVFASHHHGDHYTPRIFSLGMDNVTYVLASCIRLSAKRKAGLGIEDRCVHRMTAGVTKEIGCLQVRTVRSNDAGVAFVVQGPEGSVFHAGDLNDWRWKGEDPAWLEGIDAAWRKSLGQLRGLEVDAAFLPLDPRLEEHFYLGVHGFMENISCRMLLPMHCWGDLSVIERLKAMPESAPYRSVIAEITQENRVFYLT